jgi:hypothetical protein
VLLGTGVPGVLERNVSRALQEYADLASYQVPGEREWRC